MHTLDNYYKYEYWDFLSAKFSTKNSQTKLETMQVVEQFC